MGAKAISYRGGSEGYAVPWWVRKLCRTMVGVKAMPYRGGSEGYAVGAVGVVRHLRGQVRVGLLTPHPRLHRVAAANLRTECPLPCESAR